ncbi:stage II sporulation protein E [uncultured Clostridium sp.]|uniref:stage II sporulation protein E n=1 Tax=uncultured Clostridium sp. TaxID=59620 RepID=UPI002612B7B0|nr:stage II sporulation protein E [uncultured Clostridium sp.]
MQYGVNVKNYVRDKNIKKNNIEVANEENYIKFVMIAVIGVLLSRVYFNVNLGFMESIAPFGVLYVMVVAKNSLKDGIIALAGVVIGYVSMSNKLSEIPVFVISSILIVMLSSVFKKKRANVKLGINLASISLIIFLNGIFILKSDIVRALIVAGISVFIFLPLYYLISFGYSCVKDLKFEKYIGNDEIISIEIFLSLVLVGIGNINLFDVEIKNILIFMMVFIFSYIGRGNLGITSGIVAGIVFGLITGELYFYVTVLGICSLVVSMFKETGKFINFILFNLAFIGITVYMKNFSVFIFLEVFIGSSLCMLIPKNIIEKVRVEFDSVDKSEVDCEKHFEKMKGELMGRLSEFTGVLSAMSGTLDNMVENDKLVYQDKGDELVDSLADRVCRKCDYKNTCWKREMHETYSSFKDLIQSYEEGECKFPTYLSKKCLKEGALVRETEELVSKHIADEMLKKKLKEGRKMISSHIGSMSNTISEVLEDFSSEVRINLEVERVIKKVFMQGKIKFKYLIAYTDKDGRLNIKIDMPNCSGCDFCVKKLVPIVDKALGRRMYIASNCIISAETGLCEVHIQDAPKLYVESSVALSPKHGEKYIGDSYSFGKTKDGQHMVLLCDGMGCGARASEESKVAVEMVEKFSESGFSEKTAINTINTIMNIKFSEEERFSTLDMQKINLYDGTTKFLKVGAVESFIKRGTNITVMDSKTLPFGVLDNLDIDEKEYKLKAGDFIVTISDGILDVTKNGDMNNSWLIELLEKSAERNSKDLANKILDTAKAFNNGKAKDDMTVIVSKLYNIK